MFPTLSYKLLAQPAKRSAWWILVLASLMSLADLIFSPLNFTLLLRIEFVLFALFKASVLYVILLSCRHKVARCLMIAFLIGFGVLAVVNVVGFTIYQTGISRRLIAILGETSMREISEFMPQLADNLPMMFTDTCMVYTILGSALLAVILRLINTKTFNSLLALTILAGVVVSGVFLAKKQVWGKVHLSVYARVITHVRGYAKEVKALDELLAQSKAFPNADKVTSEQLTDNVVLVIGESALRRHHSLYGYPLSTTPRLDALADSLVVFSDVIGSSIGTNDNISRILTFRRDFDTDEWYRYPSMIEMMKHAGYRTYWLSNQEKGGFWSNCSAGIALTADVVNYVGALSSEDNLISRFDEDLLEPVSKALTDTSRHRLVMCHLLGSHVQYKYRYPASMAEFTPDSVMKKAPKPHLTHEMAQTISEYDNSIRYTDYVIGRIIEMVQRCDKPSVLIYLSDHGEMVYDEGEFCGRNRDCAEVPMIIYANSAFRQRCADKMREIEEARDRRITSANLVYALMNITGTKYPLYDAKLDFLSPEFESRQRFVDETPWEKDSVKLEGKRKK